MYLCEKHYSVLFALSLLTFVCVYMYIYVCAYIIYICVYMCIHLQRTYMCVCVSVFFFSFFFFSVTKGVPKQQKGRLPVHFVLASPLWQR